MLLSPFSLTSAHYGALLVPIQIDTQEDPQTDYSRTEETGKTTVWSRR